MDVGLITMNTETDDVFFTPFTASKLVGVHSPFSDWIHKFDVTLVSIRVGSVKFLITESKFLHNITVTTKDNVHKTIGRVL